MTHEEFQAGIARRYPYFTVGKFNDRAAVTGTLEIAHEGIVAARYQVALQVPLTFPDEVPKVFETGNTIPKTLDRHFNEDGSACLFVRDEKWKYCHSGTTPLSFLSGPVYSFFLNQAHFDECGRWLFGNRPHGIPGIVDYYKEEFGCRRVEDVVRVLDCLAKEVIKGRWHCPCGRGGKLKYCHIEVIEKLREALPRQYFQNLKKIIAEGDYKLPEGENKRVKNE